MNTIPQAIRALLEELQTDTTQDRAERIGQALAQYPESAPAPVITVDTPVDYGNDAIREHSEHLARNEVYYCVSHLVQTMAQNLHEATIFNIDSDKITAICVRDDWETPAREYIDGLDASDLKETAEYLGVDGADDWDADADDTEAMESAIITHCEEDPDQWRELCDFNRLEPYTVEAYEHWIVSDWLARQLEEHGEMVSRDFLGLTIWGRCTTGQSMSMDHIMLTIARDNLIQG